MKSTLCYLLAISLLGLGALHAKDDAPRGFKPISELESAKSDAIEKQRLLVVVVKGANDACPNCVTSLANGERAIGSGVVKVFARAEALNSADLSGHKKALK